MEGELVEDGLAADGDEGEDLLLSLARSLTERVEASEGSLEGLFAGVRQTEHEVEAALRPDDLAPDTPAGRDGSDANEAPATEGEQSAVALTPSA